MSLWNKIKFHLGFAAVAKTRGKYVITEKRSNGRLFYDKVDKIWYPNIYGDCYYETHEEAAQALEFLKLKPV